MTKVSFLGIILCIITYILIALSISIEPIRFIIHIFLLITELIALIRKKSAFYIISTLFLGLVSVSLFQYLDILNSQLVILYFVGYLLILIYGYNYIFKNSYNKMDLEFKKLEIPHKEDFIACKYISGLPYKYLGNAIITKDENNIYIKIESPKSEHIYEMAIGVNQLLKIESNPRPYILTEDMNREGMKQKRKKIKLRRTTTFDKPDVKVIPSYNLTIRLKNGTIINLVSFNNPARFFN